MLDIICECVPWVHVCYASHIPHLAMLAGMLCTRQIIRLVYWVCCVCLFHSRYGIRNIQVFASSAHAVVQDCMEAEGSADARDKLFM